MGSVDRAWLDQQYKYFLQLPSHASKHVQPDAAKTTLDIQDELLARAKRLARETGGPLRAVVEEGLRRVLSSSPPRNRYTLPDLRVGNPRGPDPLAQYSWPEFRELICGDRG